MNWRRKTRYRSNRNIFWGTCGFGRIACANCVRSAAAALPLCTSYRATSRGCWRYQFFSRRMQSRLFGSPTAIRNSRPPVEQFSKTDINRDKYTSCYKQTSSYDGVFFFFFFVISFSVTLITPTKSGTGHNIS